jgi:hypothetical protein
MVIFDIYCKNTQKDWQRIGDLFAKIAEVTADVISKA